MKKSTFSKLPPFLLAGLLIGLFLTLQLKSDVIQTSSYPLDEYELQTELVQTFQNDQDELEIRLNEISTEVESAQENTARLYGSIDDNYLNNLKQTLGLTAVSGQGVVIKFDDSELANRENLQAEANSLVHASDLRDLVNVLRAFSYQAITINDQRIVASTSISSAGTSILVNHFQLLPPFDIQIITEVPELVIQALTDEELLASIYSRMETTGLQFKFKKEDELTAPAYIGGYRTNYLTVNSNE